MFWINFQSGGFEIYDIKHLETYELYRIIKNISLDTYTIETLYYQNNELIYGKIEKNSSNNNKLIIEYPEEYNKEYRKTED